jgi:hypothetical protein
VASLCTGPAVPTDLSHTRVAPVAADVLVDLRPRRRSASRRAPSPSPPPPPGSSAARS